MMRLLLLAAAVLTLAGSAESQYTFNQRGTVAAPRAALSDGQPLDTRTRIEGHAGASVGPSEPNPTLASSTGDGSGAAVATRQAGAALRFRAGKVADLGLEIDGEWAPTSTTREGRLIAAPDDAVVDVALAFRASTGLSDDGTVRLGWVANLGGHSTPIVRNSGSSRRDTALLFRAALVPSIRRGVVTLFGSVGMASETDVPGTVVVSGSDNDPGAVAEVSGAALTLAAGARVDLGKGARLTARIGDAITGEDNGHYGPQVDVGMSFDVSE